MNKPNAYRKTIGNRRRGWYRGIGASWLRNLGAKDIEHIVGLSIVLICILIAFSYSI